MALLGLHRFGIFDFEKLRPWNPGWVT